MPFKLTNAAKSEVTVNKHLFFMLQSRFDNIHWDTMNRWLKNDAPQTTTLDFLQVVLQYSTLSLSDIVETTDGEPFDLYQLLYAPYTKNIVVQQPVEPNEATTEANT